MESELMKKSLSLILALLIMIMSFGAYASDVPAADETTDPAAAATEEITPAPTEEPTPSPTPVPTATPTVEPLPPFPESPTDIHVKEENGGEFRSLPLDIEQGGAKLVPFTYTSDISIYEDPSIRVEYHRVNGGKTWGVVYYFADIVIKEPTQMRTSFATNTTRFNPNAKKTVRAISSRLNPVIAINGDFFAGFSGNAFVLRQGDVYRDSCEPNFDVLLVDEDGDFHVITADQDLASIDKTTVDGKKVINAFQFGPALVIDGQPVEDEKLVDRAHSPRDAQPDMANQRMGIMQIDKLHYMVLTCAHYGLTLPKFRDLAMYVSNYQAKTIYTLDGGNSSQMIFLGRKKNNTDTNPDTAKDKEGERPVTDIIYFASAWFTR